MERYCQKDDCRTKYAIDEMAKRKAAQKKAADLKWKREKEDLKENTTNWKNKLQVEINKIVRQIDRELLCLATGRRGKMDAGHILSRGSNITIRFNLHNIHRQCAQSNHFQNDDGLLREGLVREYGQEYKDFIMSLQGTPPLLFKDFEYRALIAEAHEIVVKLIKLDATYSLKSRLKLRNKINHQLRIYSQEFCFFNYESNTSNISNTSNND